MATRRGHDLIWALILIAAFLSALAVISMIGPR